jgi:hypothetical protein
VQCLRSGIVRLAGILFALCVGCASDGGSDKGDCGKAGCECNPEAGCDIGFECESSVEICIPSDCVPGFADCVCSEGQCTEGYHCEGGVCAAGGATTVTSGPESTGPQPTGTSTDPGTSTTDASGDPSSATMTTETADDASTTESSNSNSNSNSNTGEPTCADERDCEACLACAIAEAGPCAMDHEACQGNAQCMGLETCAANCATGGQGGECVNQCCGLFTSGDMPPYSSLSACTNDACGDLCPDFAC